MRAKIFAKSSGPFGSLADAAQKLEPELNAWLESNPGVRVIQVQQSATAGGIFIPDQLVITVLYELEP
jgi:hypothetical protein